MPVKARTSAVLPWSMWPAVPAMMLRIASLFIVLLALVAPARAQEPDVTFKTGVSDVRVVAQVTENGQIVKSLKQVDFIVRDEGKAQPIVAFAREAESLNLVLLLDISGSMGKFIEQMATTARDALRYLKPGDRVAVMTLGSRSNLHSDFNDNHAEVARQLATATEDTNKVGLETAINQGVIDATQLLARDEDPGPRAILIVTDNIGENVKASDARTIEALLKADAVLSSIVVGNAPRPGRAKPGANPEVTEADVYRLAEATGGDVVQVERADKSFPEMIARIRDRYTIAYHAPADAKPGEFRRISVELTPEARKLYTKAEIRSRSGYYVKE